MPAAKRPGPESITHRGVTVKWSDKRHRYEGKVSVGRRADNSLDRRNVYGKDPAEAKSEIQRLQALADKKIPIPAGRVPTVEAFFGYWLDELHLTLKRPLAPTTVDSYRSECRNWIFPVIGKKQLDDVTVADLTAIYLRMTRAKLSGAHLRKVHSIISRGLGLAMMSELIHRNVAELRENPGSTKVRKPRPLSAEQVRSLFEAIRRHPTALRWMVGLALGPRQGEALGLTWSSVDLDEGTVSLDWQLQRRKWRHGCRDPQACAAAFCRRERCTPSWEHGCADPGACYAQTYRCPARYRGTSCPRHTRPCPKPCPSGCTRHAARCPRRAGGGLVFARPKQFKGVSDEELLENVVSLPRTLVKRLAEHKARQDAVKAALGGRYDDHHLVFCQPDGRPVDPRRDLDDWHEVLALAGLPPAGTHLSRHTAASVLYEEGQDVTSVQNVLGHADIRTARGYGRRRGKHLTERAAAATERALFAPVSDLGEQRERKRRRRAAG